MAKRIPRDLKPGAYFTVEPGLYVRKTRDGILRWGISYMMDGQLRRETVGASKVEAREALAQRRVDISRDKFNLPAKDRRTVPTFKEFADTYLEYSKKHNESWTRDKWALEKAKGFFGSKRLDEVSTFDIERYKAHRRETVQPSTTNRDIALLKVMMARAIEWGHLKENPAKPVKLYKEQEKAPRVITVKEEKKLVKAAAPHLKPIILFGLNTGMRIGEITALKWDNIDVHGEVKYATVTRSKSKKVRKIPLNELAMGAMHRAGWLAGGYVFKYKGQQIISLRRSFATAVEKAGIPHCTAHDMRHTFATRLLTQMRVDPETAQRILGHADIRTTMRYVHTSDKLKVDAVRRLERLYGARKSTELYVIDGDLAE